MRLTELPLIEEVRDAYMTLRYDGKDRTYATEILIQDYSDEIAMGADDDGLQFWIGLADGQCKAKELTAEVAQKGLLSLARLRELIPEITVGDIERRRERYALAPMPERKLRRVKKFRCSWNIGDTFAYQLSGQEAEKLGIAGKYMLFRKVDEREFDKGNIFPMVTVSLWNKPSLPHTTQEYQSVPLLKINNRRRRDVPEDRYEYRALICFKNNKQYEATPLHFIGNFQNATMPNDEIIIHDGGECTLLLPEIIDSSCCIYWKMHLYCMGNQQS